MSMHLTWFGECYCCHVIWATLIRFLSVVGAVKVTPAHDHTDFLLSQRHSLPRLTVIEGNGTMTSSCGEWLKVIMCKLSITTSYDITQSTVSYHCVWCPVYLSYLLLSLFHFVSFKGVKRFDARQLVVDALLEKKLFRGKTNHATTLPICR